MGASVRDVLLGTRVGLSGPDSQPQGCLRAGGYDGGSRNGCQPITEQHETMVFVVFNKKMAAERKWCPPCREEKGRAGQMYFMVHQCWHKDSTKPSPTTKTRSSTGQILAQEQAMSRVLQTKLLNKHAARKVADAHIQPSYVNQETCARNDPPGLLARHTIG